MRDARLNATCRFFAMGAAALLAGCTVDLSGLNQLLDPDPTYLSLPGRKLASGKLSDPAVGGTDAEGSSALALEHSIDPLGDCRHDGDVCTVAIAPFNDPKGRKCNTGPSDGGLPRTFQFGVRDTRPMTFSFTNTETVDGNDERSLHFVNPSCEEMLTVADSSIPFWPDQPLEDPPGYLTLTSPGDFLLLQPWESKQKTVASGVRLIRQTQNRFWSLERHPDALDENRYQLVVRDLNSKEVARIGDNVREFDVTEQSKERAAYIEDGKLWVVTVDDFTKSTAIAEDACEVAFPPGFRGRGLSFFSPCDDRRLVLFGNASDSGAAPGPNDKTYQLNSQSKGDPAILYRDKAAYAFQATTDGGDPETLTLWGGKLGDKLESLGSAPSLSGGNAPRMQNVTEGFQFFLDISHGVARLVRWKPGSKVREVATQVRECTGQLCLSNFDGDLGDAIFVPGTGDPRPIASGVPQGVLSAADSGLGVIADFADGMGTLLVGKTDGTGFEEVARGVPSIDGRPRGFQFLRNLAAVAYVRDYDKASGMGAMGVRVIDTGDTFDTGVRASDWQEIGWPQPGLLYIVTEGQDQGMWFAPLM